jgi:hypothetical protein
MKIYRFEEVVRCPKCTYNKFLRTYRDEWYLFNRSNIDNGILIKFREQGIELELFTVKCNSCGYYWWEFTADAEPSKIAPTIEEQATQEVEELLNEL